MNYYILSKSVVGYKNKLKGKLSQDYYLYKNIDNGILLAVADGHSGEYFTFSHKGAKIACKSFIDVISKYINDNKGDFDSICRLLSCKTIQIDISNKWRKDVYNDFFSITPRAYKMEYFRYGTTLLGMYINDKYSLFLRLGDGEILINKNYTFKKIFVSQQKKFVDTMPDENAFDKMQYKISRTNCINYMPIIAYTDGYENSFKSYNDMIKDLHNTIYKYEKNVFTRINLENNYEAYLSMLSKNGSRDDITICFVNNL